MLNARSWLPSLLILACVLFSLPYRGEESDLLRSEQIGPLKIGFTEAEVKATLGAKAEMGPVEKWEADGLFHQKWTFKDRGVEIGMATESSWAPKKVESISISSPCDFATKRGMRIGSPESDVLKAYKGDLDKEASKPGEILVAGSVYGGLIFTIKNGKVQAIFLGAAAE